MAKLQTSRIPQSLESERALIGAAFDSLNTSESADFDLARLRTIVSAEMFYAVPDHRAIWQGIIDADDNGDPITLASVLPRLNGKTDAEWREDIKDCLAASDPANTKYHAGVILAAAEKRDGIRVLERCMERLADPTVESAGALFEKLEDDLRKIGAGARRRGVSWKSAADIKPTESEWLWYPWIPRKMISLLAGEGGQGKSQVTIDFIARITTGRGWPDDSTAKRPPGDCVILSAEDPADCVIVPRLIRAEADLSRVRIVSGVCETTGRKVQSFDFDEDIHELQKMLKQFPQTQLVVVDPLNCYLGKRVDSHKDDSIRRVLGPIADLAEETDTAILGICHLTKNSETTRAVHRILGSAAYGNAARSVMIVVPPKADDTDRDKRYFMHAKCNLSRLAKGFTFRSESNGREQPRILWDAGRVETTADEMMAPKPPTAKKEAAKWLRELLADGPKPQAEIKIAAKQEGHSWSTVEKAKKLAGVYSEQVRGGDKVESWIWGIRSS